MKKTSLKEALEEGKKEGTIFFQIMIAAWIPYEVALKAVSLKR